MHPTYPPAATRGGRVSFRPVVPSTAQAGCPSGQREQTVNLPALPTLVRTQHPPRPDSPQLLGAVAVSRGEPGRERCWPAADALGAWATGAASARRVPSAPLPCRRYGAGGRPWTTTRSTY